MQIIPALRGTWTRHDMNMETMRHSQILYFCKERRPLIIMLPHVCHLYCASSLDCVTWPDFEQAYLHFPHSTCSRTKTKQSFQWSTDKSAGGDHTQKGCLLHSLATGTHCHCQPGDVLYMSQLILVFLSQSERLSQKKALNSEGTVQKQESRWMPWRAFQVPANHVPHLLGGMQSIVN